MRPNLLLFVLVGCGAVATKPATSPGNHAGANRADAARQADELIADDAPLDYARSPLTASDRRSRAKQLYLDACAAGDPRSCRVAMNLVSEPEVPHVIEMVAENCRAGDQLSCRAIPRDEDTARYPTLAGAIGRSCYLEDCDLTALQVECKAGFPRSCHRRRGTGVRPAEDKENDQRKLELSISGCKAGVAEECIDAGYSLDPEVSLGALRQRCLLDRTSCTELGDKLKELGRKLEARDEYERACQYGAAPEVCYTLGEQYRTGVLPEPVPARADSITRYACEVLARSAPDDLLKNWPDCRAAKHP